MNWAPTVSVAMATFNGEDWLDEQLSSIRQQTYPPHELVVFDDGSTDRTLEILERFSAEATFEVRVSQNPIRLGYVRNFERAMSASLGEVIFLCDQDDVWSRSKIERVLEVLAASPAELVVHDLRIVDAGGNPQPLTMLERIDLLRASHECHVKGCATAVRRSLLNRSLPIPDSYSHDSWLHALAADSGGRTVIEEVLTDYRIHSRNTSTNQLNRLDPPQRARWWFPHVGRLRLAMQSTESMAIRLAQTEALLGAERSGPVSMKTRRRRRRLRAGLWLRRHLWYSSTDVRRAPRHPRALSSDFRKCSGGAKEGE